jgi:hypothetical protein
MAHQDNPRGFLFGKIMTNEQIKRGTDKSGRYAGSIDLSGCDLNGITLPTTIGGSIDLSGCDLNGITLPTTIGGSIDLSGCDLKGITLPTTIGGSIYLSGCDLKGITLPTTIGGYLDLSGDQWASIAFSDLQKFAAPWFAEKLAVEDISEKTNWCEDGIREAMGMIGLECDDDVTEYDRAEVHAALKRAAKAIGDDEKCAIALAILDRVESGK